VWRDLHAFLKFVTNSEKFFVMINKEEGCRSLN